MMWAFFNICSDIHLEGTDKTKFFGRWERKSDFKFNHQTKVWFFLELHRNPLAPERFPESLHFEIEFANANQV